MARTLKRRAAATAVSIVPLAPACSSSGESTEHDGFFGEVGGAVSAFSAALDTIDGDLRARSWDSSTDSDSAVDSAWRAELDVLAAYLKAWESYVEKLEALDPPEGFPEAGEMYAAGFSEYFRTEVVAAEREASEATRAYRNASAAISDPEAARLFLGRGLPEQEWQRFSESSAAMSERDDLLEDEWNLFGETAEAIGHPIEVAVSMRIDGGMHPMVWRVTRLIEDICLDALADAHVGDD